MALAKKEGPKPTDLHRMLWALGFAAYTKPNSGRNLNTLIDRYIKLKIDDSYVIKSFASI